MNLRQVYTETSQMLMSLLNSIIADAVVCNNNDDVLRKLDEIKNELEEMKRREVTLSTSNWGV